MLNFKKNDIIKLSENINDHHAPGLLYGDLENRHGAFPHDYVRPIPSSEVSLASMNKSNDEKSSSHYLDEKLNPNNSQASWKSQYQDGHFSMMEFAMIYFKQSLEK